MSGHDDPAAALEELRRYVSRRRQTGLDVIHLVDRPGGAGRGSMERQSGAVDDSKDRPGGADHEGRLRRETGAATGRAQEMKDVRKSGSVEAGPVRREGPQSIRFRPDARSPSQESLFAEKRAESEPDLSGLDLASLDKVVSVCSRCRLSETRTKTVFGSGPAKARIVFIGEAPGREEDLQGLPFVGRAGQLLTKILASIGVSRDEVYITNILKCRPPENRDPQEDEVRSCEIYLHRQIELIEPVLICALGRIAAQSLLHCTASLSALRENLHFYNDTKVVVTYHPAALLRNPNLKRPAWEDIKVVRRMYDEALAGG